MILVYVYYYYMVDLVKFDHAEESYLKILFVINHCLAVRKASILSYCHTI